MIPYHGRLMGDPQFDDAGEPRKPLAQLRRENRRLQRENCRLQRSLE